MKKFVLLCFLLTVFSLLTGCMGPLMHGGHDDNPDEQDGSHMGHHH